MSSERTIEGIIQPISDYHQACDESENASRELFEALKRRSSLSSTYLATLFNEAQSAERRKKAAEQRVRPQVNVEAIISMADIKESGDPSGLDDHRWSGLSDH